MKTLVALVLFLLGSVAVGQPAGVNRVLRAIDFEERALGNAEDLPMHWTKVQGPDMPHYINGALTTERARSGRYSFRLELNGGSLLYRYDPAQFKVMAGAHYHVEGWAQTVPMPNARACLTAYFLDADKRPMPATMKHATPYAATTDQEGWKKLSVDLSADLNGASYLVMEIGLLQPERYTVAPAGEHPLFAQDIHGVAWFDDITVSQVPQVTLGTGHAGNIFRHGEPLQLQVVVNDRFTDDLSAQLILKDATGAPVYQRSGALDMASGQVISPGQNRMLLELPPDLKPGWYEASLVMRSKGVLLGEQSINLVELPETAGTTPPDPRFGLIATSLPFNGWTELPEILPNLGAGRVKLAVWSEMGDVEQADSGAFDALLARLAELGITPTACLVDLPPLMAKKLGGPAWTGLLNAKREDWQPQLAYLIAAHANHLDRWQFGVDGTEAFVTQPEMRKVYELLYNEFAALIQNPDLAMPWPAWYELDGEAPATIALSVPTNVLPSQIPLYMQDLKGGKGPAAKGGETKSAVMNGPAVSLSLQLLDRKQYGREVQIRDLAQRVVYALSADARRIDLPLPFEMAGSGENIARQPSELMMIERTLITTLSGATFRGKVPVAEGVEAFLFDRDGTGILCLWDKGSVGGEKQLEINPGANPKLVDLWGNATPLLSSAEARRDGKIKMAVGPMPVFLVDIDGPLAQLRTSVAFDRPLVESSFHAHMRRIRFINPYKQAISGSLHLCAPAGWTVEPPTLSFSLNSGETFDREVSLSFPYNSVGGNKSVMAEFEVQADKASTFVVPLTLKLGLSDLGMQTVAMREGKDVVVQQIISNYGDSPINYSTFAIFPGQARQERLVTNLGPGQTTIKRYRFSNVGASKAGFVRVGVKELVGTRLLNDQVAIQ